MIKTIYNTEEVIEFAWELGQNNFYASYPRKKTIKETEEAIERSIREENRKVIACYNENVLRGVCMYYWEPSEKYAQTEMFLIKEDYGQIAEEFIGYISKELHGYEIYIGFPIDNENANKYFMGNNIECLDHSIDTRLYNLSAPVNKEYEQVERITENNFEEYAAFHDKYAIPFEMYYNSKNLHKDMERFRVFVFRQDEAIHGSIFVKTFKDGAEVFGLFIDEEYKNNGIEGILINEMLFNLYKEFGALKEIVYFIDEDSSEELNIALSSGFEIKDRYRCYKYKL
ncbi:hypothetical protein IAI10_01575 [Clostridium sp. 19966]|uniref:hypothetical protein n=1 Tax=Clostridium sp. 19966 TaxID=2768166 RepID=UPI0028DF2BA8|nr:hypothetical protein [Clostridium sp. 19966]MDT8715365.1 hypothetical protein [Clostridium sp. 19966]